MVGWVGPTSPPLPRGAFRRPQIEIKQGISAAGAEKWQSSPGSPAGTLGSSRPQLEGGPAERPSFNGGFRQMTARFARRAQLTKLANDEMQKRARPLAHVLNGC